MLIDICFLIAKTRNCHAAGVGAGDADDDIAVAQSGSDCLGTLWNCDPMRILDIYAEGIVEIAALNKIRTGVSYSI